MKHKKRDERSFDGSLMTPREVSEIYRISLNGLYRLAERREIPFCRIGHQFRFRRADVEEYLRRNTIERVETSSPYGYTEDQEEVVG